MELLKKRIQKDGIVGNGGVLKVDSFLNHQIDIELYNEIGKEFKRRFADKNINKILTIEASGIGIACIAAQYFNVPVLFAKKTESRNLDTETFQSEVYSFTKEKDYRIRVSKKYLKPTDHVLIIDDFLANGRAVLGLMDIIGQAGATLEGVGIVIEKAFQDGGEVLRSKGVQVESLAKIISMDKGFVEFE